MVGAGLVTVEQDQVRLTVAFDWFFGYEKFYLLVRLHFLA